MADTSAWIFHLRDQVSLPVVQKLRDPSVEGQVILGDIILCEVLNGVTNDKAAQVLERQLRKYPIVTMGGDVLAVHAARNYRKLRSLGITMSKLPDLLIGTYCILNNHQLLHADKDYDAMEQHCGLQVY